jgi:hypothetical protein
VAAVTLADVPVETIQARAAEIRFGKFVLSLIAWPLYWAGWLVAKLLTVVVWRSAKYVAAAVMVGYKEANGPSKRSVIEQQRATIANMQMRLSRFEG